MGMSPVINRVFRHGRSGGQVPARPFSGKYTEHEGQAPLWLNSQDGCRSAIPTNIGRRIDFLVETAEFFYGSIGCFEKGLKVREELCAL